jgi:hypothetical protein
MEICIINFSKSTEEFAVTKDGGAQSAKLGPSWGNKRMNYRGIKSVKGNMTDSKPNKGS